MTHGWHGVRNQGLNRAPGSWKPHFSIWSRSEISMNGIPLPLYPFPLAFQPVHEASCRPPSPLPGVVIASCQLSFLATLLAVVLSIQVANVVLTTVVADQSEARTQSPEDVAKLTFVGFWVSRQLLTPRGRSPTKDPRKTAQCFARERQQQSTKAVQQQYQLEHSKTLYCLTCVDESPDHNDHEHTNDSS